MTPDSVSSFERSLYERGLSLAEEGDSAGALRNIQGYLERRRDDGQAWNDAGVLLYQMNRTRDAIDCFERARGLECDRGLLCRNLFYAYIAEGRSADGIELIDEMQYCGALSGEVVRDAVETLTQRGDISGAAEIAIEAGRYRADDGEVRRLIESLRARRAKIAFFCGGDGDTFLRDIYDYVGKRFCVRVFEGDTVEQVGELMAWSDISWFEWCTNVAEIGSKLPKVCSNIVRLHRYEAHQGWAPKINWANVDALITVGNRSVEELLLRQVPGLKRLTRMVTIPNGVDMEKVKFVRRKRGKNIAFVGNMRMVKNPMLVLQCMKRLHEIDEGYRLFIAGKTQDLEVEQYVRHMIDAMGLQNTVMLDGWQGDINSWLGDKQYIVLTSVIESQGMGMLEGMASGLKGVVHNFPGAGGIYPEELLFNTPDEFCEIITSDDYSPAKYRSFVERRYSLREQLRRTGGLLGELERNGRKGASGRPLAPGGHQECLTLT